MRSGNLRIKRAWACALIAAASVVVGGTTARANNHLWDLSELYSNSSGSVQFVEMHDDFNLEGFVFGHTLTATDAGGTQSHVFTFPANLPNTTLTANHFMLIATAGFASLPGGVTPDYTLPPNFLFTGGGTLTFSGSGDSITYGPLPTDGANSLTINLKTEPHTSGTAINSPINFAGAAGSVPESTLSVIAVGAGLAWATAARRQGRGRGGPRSHVPARRA